MGLHSLTAEFMGVSTGVEVILHILILIVNIWEIDTRLFFAK